MRWKLSEGLTMQFTIQKYESKDREQLKHLLHLCFEDDTLLNVLNNTHFKFAYVAILENKLVGSMFAWTSSMHPYCTYFRILIHPFYHWLNIEEKLLSKIDELKVKNLPLQTSIWDTSVNLKELYISNDFKEIRRTYMPHLKLADIQDDLPYKNEKQEIKSLTEILSNVILLEKLIFLVKRNYEQTHAVNPVKELSLEKWKTLILCDELLADGSFVYLDKDKKNIIAYSFLHKSDTKNALELGWCGAIDMETKNLIPRLIAYQINYVKKRNIHVVSGEFDTTDDYAMEVLNSFPFAPCPSWITYQRLGEEEINI